MTIAQFENHLVGLQGAIEYLGNSDAQSLFDYTYPTHQEYLSEVEISLKKIEMFEPVKAAFAHSEALAREGKYEDASNVILEVNRILMRASGTWDRLEKRFPKKDAR